jgi:hypothetical protein
MNKEFFPQYKKILFGGKPPPAGGDGSWMNPSISVRSAPPLNPGKDFICFRR